MSRRTPTSALADVAATLVEEYDAVGSLTHLVNACGEVQDAFGVGVLVRGAHEPAPADGRTGALLELLAATSHETAHLELYQDQASEGPCLDAIASDAPVCVVGPDAISATWPVFGPAIVEHGVRAVWAVPMRWRGTAFGALNLFRADERPLEGDALALTRTFADLSTVLIMHARALPGLDDVTQDVQQALDGRIVIEQAKGVLMVQAGVDAGVAFALLVRRAEEDRVTLTALARSVVEQAARTRSSRS
jgi:GAF domain-containing protein